MGLSATQLGYLRNADQRFRAHVAVFAAYAPTITPPTPADATGTRLTPKPLPVVEPRCSVVANSGTVLLSATQSVSRGNTYVGNGNVSWALISGGGTLVDNGNGTATYTAPAGSATARIDMTATNGNGSKTARAFVQFPKTTYDEIVAELASITGSLDSHGWKALLRVKGSGADFTLGKRVLIHVEDTWAGTTSTPGFNYLGGALDYPEGTMLGVISALEYFEDSKGESWLGLEVQSAWYWLEKMKMGETWWGTNSQAGAFYIQNFTPADAVWHFVNEITDFTLFHNVRIFPDQNVIDDFIVDEAALGTIVADCMKRTYCESFFSRMDTLLCVPSPDIRASEWYGSASPVYDSTAAGPLTYADVQDVNVTYYPYQVRKLTLEALDSSKMGIHAFSENTTQVGDIITNPVGKMICDSPFALVQWAKEARAAMNRPWDMTVTMPLNHVLDLASFVDVNFTAMQQASTPTASGRAWVADVNYRPDVFNGGWIGQWHLNKITTGDTDGTSGWHQSGQTGLSGGVSGYGGPAGVVTGSSLFTSGTGGWQSGTGGDATSFCIIYDFVNSGTQGWRAATTTEFPTFSGSPLATHVPGVGWSAVNKPRDPAAPFDTFNQSASLMAIVREFPSRYISSITFWGSGDFGASALDAEDVRIVGSLYIDNLSTVRPVGGVFAQGAAAATALQNAFFESIHLTPAADSYGTNYGLIVLSAQVCGSSRVF